MVAAVLSSSKRMVNRADLGAGVEHIPVLSLLAEQSLPLSEIAAAPDLAARSAHDLSTGLQALGLIVAEKGRLERTELTREQNEAYFWLALLEFAGPR